MKAALLLVSTFIVVSKCLADSNTLWNDTATDRLKHDLLKNYDTSVRPEHFSVATKLKIAFTIIHIDLDETRGVLTTHGWLKMNWTDSKLSWNPSDYDNLATLHIPSGDIWQPDLTIYNSAANNLIDHYGKTNTILYNNGHVLWVPPSKFETFCSFDFKYWPFDVQTCSIVIGSWTYSGYQIDLTMDEPIPVDSTNYVTSEWTIVKTTHERHDKIYPCCIEPYIDITFNLTLQRVSPMYKAVTCTPATLIVVMTLASFWLPPQSGEKILLNGIACVIICILLMYFSQLLPILAISPPLIVIFYSHTLYLLCISTIISVSVINLSRNKKQKAVPHFIKTKILNGIIGKIFGNSITIDSNVVDELRDAPFEDIPTADDHQMIQVPTKNKSTAIHNEWYSLAIIVDRITFFIYLIIFLLMGFFHFV
ncbi:unnamed protein product [Diamesa serratosioi]